jgi:sec-independent protein translocase protein TatC
MGDSSTKKDLPDSTMSLGEHLEELRIRLFLALGGLAVGLIICLFFGKYIIAFVKVPYTAVIGQDALLSTFAPAEVITCYVKICLISGLIISSPWVFYQIWMFIAAGLYPHEKKYVHMAVPFSAGLFVAGALFFLFLVAPGCLRLLIKFNEILGLLRTWRFDYYISFVTQLMLVFGIAFQTPTAIFFLNRTGLVSLKALTSSRKYVILVIVIVAAIVTPPDVVSQIALAIPLYMLFELGILLCYIASRRKKTHN